MQTKILWPWELPKHIDGVAVVCDVWAATTNIVSFFRKGAKNILIVNNNNVQKAKSRFRDALIIGESLQLPKNFFDSSNYPTDIEKIDVKNKTILYMSNNGSIIIELALKKSAKKIITVSFTNITSVNEYLRDLKETIYLIPSGDMGSSDKKGAEDLICVESLGKMLKAKNVNLNIAQEEAKGYIRTNYADEKFNRNLNFKIAFNLDSSKVVPICSQEKEGWIKVTRLFPTPWTTTSS
ncbi:MAG: 2-phosphosulfolactate phosphatase [Candidatus Levybacteria bacterium]|nr:2-phosphosulfolactate phosphatase [Candidatus Levybacteria bacterium]